MDEPDATTVTDLFMIKQTPKNYWKLCNDITVTRSQGAFNVSN